MTAGRDSGRVYVLRWCGPVHGGRERNPPRIPACGSPLDPVGGFHPGTRPASPRARRANVGSLRLQPRSGRRIGSRAPTRCSPKFMRFGSPFGPAGADRVAAGREGLPDTAHHQREAPMTVQAAVGASLFETASRSAERPSPPAPLPVRRERAAVAAQIAGSATPPGRREPLSPVFDGRRGLGVEG